MRLQTHVPLADAGLPNPCFGPEAERGVHEMINVLAEHGIGAKADQDFADVGEGDGDWAALTPEEQEGGGYDYPELLVAGPCYVAICIFRTEIFISTDSSFDDDQADAAHVIKVFRALQDKLPLPAREWDYMIDYASGFAVDADGNIERPILGFSELSDAAIALFDEASSPELIRPAAEAYVRDHGQPVRDVAAGIRETFTAHISTSPGGGAFSIEMPRTPDRKGFRPGYDKLRESMIALLNQAAAEDWEATGLPTALRVVRSADGTIDVHLVFDNFLDSGVFDAAERKRTARSAPFSWESATAVAAARDPRFQPTWLPAAVDLLHRGGETVEVNSSELVRAEDVPQQVRDLTPSSDATVPVRRAAFLTDLERTALESLATSVGQPVDDEIKIESQRGEHWRLSRTDTGYQLAFIERNEPVRAITDALPDVAVRGTLERLAEDYRGLRGYPRFPFTQVLEIATADLRVLAESLRHPGGLPLAADVTLSDSTVVRRRFSGDGVKPHFTRPSGQAETDLERAENAIIDILQQVVAAHNGYTAAMVSAEGAGRLRVSYVRLTNGTETLDLTAPDTLAPALAQHRELSGGEYGPWNAIQVEVMPARFMSFVTDSYRKLEGPTDQEWSADLYGHPRLTGLTPPWAQALGPQWPSSVRPGEVLPREAFFGRQGDGSLALTLKMFIAKRARGDLPKDHPGTLRVRCTYTPKGFEFETAHVPGSCSDTALDFAFDTDAEVARAFVFLHELDGRTGNLWHTATVETGPHDHTFTSE